LLDGVDLEDETGWRAALAEVEARATSTGWRVAVVLGVDGDDATIGIEGVDSSGRCRSRTPPDGPGHR
jgi:hypothetical protein